MIAPLLVACGSVDETVTSSKNCGGLGDFKAKRVQYFSNMIQVLGINRSVAFDLITNEMTCRKPEGEPFAEFTGEPAEQVQQDIQNFLDGSSDIKLRQVPKSGDTSFADFVGQTCEKLSLPFVFSVERPGSTIVGCQTTDLSKSAVMWKQSDQRNTVVEIASLPIYGPLLDRVFVSRP